MKVLTTTGLTKLIELSKGTFLDKNNVIDVSDALATVALTGSYSDLSNKPTIASLTTTTQLAAINSGANTTNIGQITTNTSAINTINGKIPSAATSSNQLADKAFVNSSIANMAANYVTSDAQGDNFATKAALLAGPYYYEGQSYTLTNNDYALVEADETKGNATTRYIYDGSQWAFQYIVNNTPFTQAQLDAINSNITSNLVTSYNTHIADTDIHVTAADKIAWTAKQDALVSGTNIKTINNESLLGSGNIALEGELPEQSGQSGKFLTTNGSEPSWAIVDALPSQTGQSGKFLTTNGTAASWADVDALPSQSGQSGKYLTTNGTTPSWVSLTIPTTTNSITSGSTAALTSGGAYTNVVTAVAAGTTNNKINVTKAGSTSTITINNVANATTASKLGSTTVGGVTQPIYLDSGTPTALSYTIEKSVPSDAVFTDHTYTNGAGLNLTNGTTFSAKCDATTVSTNGSSQLQALGVINKKTSAAVYTWTGTKAQYDALGTYHNDWIYYITDDGTLVGDYYTKSQVDAMLYTSDHSITKDTPYLKLKDTNTAADVTTAPGTAHNGGLIQFLDKNGQASGYLYTRYETNGDVIQYLQADKKVNGTQKETQIGVGIKADGTPYTVAPTPAASTSTSDKNIATVGWINDPTKSTGLVHITGAETITGAKTFSANNTFNGTDTFTGNTQFTGNPVFISDNNTDALTIKNADDIYSVLPVETLSTNIALHDKNGEVIGGLEHYHQTDGASISQMTARQHGGSNYGTIRVGIDISGNTWCNLPTDTYGTNFHGTSTRSMWADLAENYESDKEYPVGTLIRFGGEKDITVATINCNGVISDKPGYILDSDLKNGQPVALVGKTPIRVLGKVNRFDRIVLDPEHPGLGKVQTTSDEKVIAIALKANSDVNEKLVMCVTKFNLD